MSLYYYKDMFRVENLEEAKNIILTEEAQGGDHRQRWERETTYMQSLFAEGLGDLNGKTVLDFGCGIGRLSKALVETSRPICVGWPRTTWAATASASSPTKCSARWPKQEACRQTAP